MARETFTIFGANGFIGKRLIQHLTAQGHVVNAITRDNWPEAGNKLGNVIFTVGMTAQFRGRPLATVETQVIRAFDVLSTYDIASFLYLSSTRLYQNAASTDEETPIITRPHTADAIYNLTKATAECLTLSIDNPAFRVVRLSNVFGPENDSQLFVSDIVREAATTGKVLFRSAPSSAKDYVDIRDVTETLPQIALTGKERLYNLGFGANTTNEAIASALQKCDIAVSFSDGAPEISFPEIAIERLAGEFKTPSRSLINAIPTLLAAAQERTNP